MEILILPLLIFLMIILAEELSEWLSIISRNTNPIHPSSEDMIPTPEYAALHLVYLLFFYARQDFHLAELIDKYPQDLSLVVPRPFLYRFNRDLLTAPMFYTPDRAKFQGVPIKPYSDINYIALIGFISEPLSNNRQKVEFKIPLTFKVNPNPDIHNAVKQFILDLDVRSFEELFPKQHKQWKV